MLTCLYLKKFSKCLFFTTSCGYLSHAYYILGIVLSSQVFNEQNKTISLPIWSLLSSGNPTLTVNAGPGDFSSYREISSLLYVHDSFHLSHVLQHREARNEAQVNLCLNSETVGKNVKGSKERKERAQRWNMVNC